MRARRSEGGKAAEGGRAVGGRGGRGRGPGVEFITDANERQRQRDAAGREAELAAPSTRTRRLVWGTQRN